MQGPLKPIRTTHFGYTHNHFLGDNSASDSIIIARSKQLALDSFGSQGKWSESVFWDGNPPALIRQDDVVTASDLIDPDGSSMGTDELFLLCDSIGGSPFW